MIAKEKVAVKKAAAHIIKALEHIADHNVRNHLMVALVDLKLLAPKDIILDDMLSIRIPPVAVKKVAAKKTVTKKAAARGRRKK